MLYLISFAFTLFLFRAVFMFLGQYKSKKVKYIIPETNELPSISVIVPARNEENNIIRCIDALMKSDYPNDKFEVIVVNDRSTDNTGNIIELYAGKYQNLKAVHVADEKQSLNLRGKPGALQHGINKAKGEYLMMTDADCAVNPNWIKSIAGTFITHKLNLIPAFTLIQGERKFDKIQQVEWIYMHTMASAGIAFNQPLGCYGNNLSIKKDVYEKIGGYENIKFSVTEDLALLQAVHRKFGGVHYLCDKDSAVTTLPENTLIDYIKQHRRWAVGGLDLGLRAGIFVASSVGIWLAFILSLISGFYMLAAGVFIFRVVSDSSMILYSMKKLELPSRSYFWLVPSVIFFMLMELVIPTLIIDKEIKWKGQTFKKT